MRVTRGLTRPVSIAASPTLLAYHFFSVALYSIWVLFTHPRPVLTSPGEKPVLRVARVHEYPGLIIQSIRTVRTPSHASHMITLSIFSVLESLCCIWTTGLDRNQMVGTVLSDRVFKSCSEWAFVPCACRFGSFCWLLSLTCQKASDHDELIWTFSQ